MIETEEQWKALKAAIKLANPDLPDEDLNDVAARVGDTPLFDAETGKLLVRMPSGVTMKLNPHTKGNA